MYTVCTETFLKYCYRCPIKLDWTFEVKFCLLKRTLLVNALTHLWCICIWLLIIIDVKFDIKIFIRHTMVQK